MVTAADGTELLVRHWPADGAVAGGAWAGPAWASLVLVHGLGEHSGRYEHVGDQLAGSGIETWAFDRRGNGGSAGRRGDVDRWSRLHDDLEEHLAAARDSAPDRPVVLYGHSLGGLIAAGYLLSDRPRPNFAVLSAPALDSNLASWKQAIAPILGRIVPTIPIPTGIEGSTLSRDPSVGERAAADPLYATTSTARFGALAFAEQERVRAAAASIDVPTLVIHGLDDGLVPHEASEPLALSPSVSRRTYPDLRHELHNEPEGPQIVDAVVAWLRDRATFELQPNTASGERDSR